MKNKFEEYDEESQEKWLNYVENNRNTLEPSLIELEKDPAFWRQKFAESKGVEMTPNEVYLLGYNIRRALEILDA